MKYPDPSHFLHRGEMDDDKMVLDKTPLEANWFKVGKSINYYEDARELVKEMNDDGLELAFKHLFPNAKTLDEFHLLRYRKYKELCSEVKTQFDCDDLGMCFVVALRVFKQNAANPPELARVSFSSIQALMTKDPSSNGDRQYDSKAFEETLRYGFYRNYIDPHSYVEKIVNRLKRNMTDYMNEPPATYIAPCTSLVTSSMMGKTRLMKELTKHLPLVYICFREMGSSGFPPATRGLLNWFKWGSCGHLGIDPLEEDISFDTDHLIATLRHSLFLLYLFKNLDELIKNEDNLRAIGLNLGKDNFEWMWEYFTDEDKCHGFWTKVTGETVMEFNNIRNSSKIRRALESPTLAPGQPTTAEQLTTAEPPTRPTISSHRPRKDWAFDYLQRKYGAAVEDAHQKLLETLAKLCPTLSSETFTLIVCFDEARHLCNSSAVANVQIKNSAAGGALGYTWEAESHTVLYSNFKAMRCALRYLRKATPMPRVFGLFTDTTSRLNNFQPRSSEDLSSRITKLPVAGMKQFDPVYVFTSIDAHARTVHNNYTTSDPKQVANVERLLKFGRAGWYSLYSGKSKSAPGERMYDKRHLRELAISKLLGGLNGRASLNRQLVPAYLTPKTRLCLLAVLAARLALTIGPFSAEAAEVVSSHLAVLLKADEDYHFLRIHYPSEPILAEASAQITSEIGWHYVLKALYHHMQNGIVSTGYRGELLSKVLCLMAMDDTPKPFLVKSVDLANAYWEHTQPVKVRDFLDHWLTAPGENASFTAALYQKHHHTDAKELERFLDGYVFFNHFVRLDRIVSLRAMVCAWNRGAAIMPKENAHSFDHVIPVMLAAEDGTPTTFGPMFEKWSEDEVKRACSNVSFILINSRNYTTAVSDKAAAYGCTPNDKIFEDYKLFAGDNVEVDCGASTPKTVCLSIAQGFGPRQAKEPYVNI